MPYSYTEYTGNGSTRSYTFGFTGPDSGYIRSSDIKVLVDKVLVAHTLTSSNTLELSVAPPNGSQIYIRREMPKDSTYTTFSRGNKFGEDNMNYSFLQTLYTVHEVLDGVFPSGFKFLTDVAFSGNIDADGGDINNVGTINAQNVVLGNGQSITEATQEAYNWANYPENSPVPEGDGFQFSALHFAMKSSDFADSSKSYRDSTIGYYNQTITARNDARAARDLSEDYRDSALVVLGQTEDAEAAALSYRDQALGYSNASQTYRNQSEGFRDEAEAFKNTAAGLANQASVSAQTAGGHADDADSFASSALSARDTAQTYRNEANTSRNEALAFRNQAEGFADDAAQSAAAIDPDAYAQAGSYTGNLDNVPVGLFFFSSGVNVPVGITSGIVSTSGNPTGVSRHQVLISTGNGSEQVEYHRKRTINGTWTGWRPRMSRNLIIGGYWGSGDTIPISQATLNKYERIEFICSYGLTGGTGNGARVSQFLEARSSDYNASGGASVIELADNNSYLGVSWNGSTAFTVVQSNFGGSDFRIGGVWGVY